MAGRGRGRGRGSSASFSMEQLGFQQGEALPGPVLQPPPVYPKLERKPVPLQIDPEMEYLLTLKRDFVDFVRDSPSYIRPKLLKTDIDRYSDRYQTVQPDLDLHWTHMPVELRPQATKRKAKASAKVAAPPPKKIKTPLDIAKRLEELEKVEKDSDNDDDNDEEEEEDKEQKEGDEDEEQMEEDDDEEMDAGTDYVNNYFDNGDGFLEEDDDMDDGPTY